MSKGLFITGTDTHVGKTRVSVGLLEWFKQRGATVLGMKPVASGCEKSFGQLRNADALLLQENASFRVDYELINPYAFEPAIAPHLAANQLGCAIEMNLILQRYGLLAEQADLIVVEGVGGWQVPFSDDYGVGDLAHRLNLPVIIVVGLRLGCLNHALLTFAAVQSSGCEILGWVANQLDPGFRYLEENVATLDKKLAAPMLAMVSFNKEFDPATVSGAFDGGGASVLQGLL